MSDAPVEFGNAEIAQQSLVAKSRAISAELTPLDPEKQASSEATILRFIKAAPDATLVGGWALRLHLKDKGISIPDVAALDIDFRTTPSGFASIKKAFDTNSPAELTRDFRRKGNAEPVPESMGGGTRSFMKSPDNYAALEDKNTLQHVDVFSRELPEEETVIDLSGVGINVATSEELMLRRFAQVVGLMNEKGEVVIPRKVYQYLYLNLGVIDFDKMEALWTSKDNDGKFIDAMQKLDDYLTEGQKTGRIRLEDIYH